MKKLSLLATFFLLTVFLVSSFYLCYGENLTTEEWVVLYNGPGNYHDNAVAVAVDLSGNVFVTGPSYGLGTNSDFATIKYGADGNEEWVARYNGPGNYNDYATAVAVDPSGNVYVTGRSYGLGTNYDYATIKYSSDGNEEWVRRYNGPEDSDDGASDIALDSFGNVYVTGSPCTIKYDSAGNVFWIVENTESEDENIYIREMVLDSSGNVYVAGIYEQWNPNNLSYITIKFDTNGNKLWSAVWDHTSWELAEAIAIDFSGNVFVSGWGYGYTATIKYDTNGNQEWIAYRDFQGDTYPSAMEVDASGNLYVTGWPGTVKYDNNGNEQWIVPYDPENGFAFAYDMEIAFGGIYLTGVVIGQGSDFATAKYDLNGNLNWINWYNGPGNGNDSARALAIDRSGNIFVTGFCLNNEGNSDFCTIKYSQQLTPEEKIYGLIDDVNGLVDEGKLLPDKSDGLIGKLEEALKALDKANPNVRVACNKLSDFIDQVNSCIQSGALPDPADGLALIDVANAIISELCG
jgi:hypothetical protein